MSLPELVFSPAPVLTEFELNQSADAFNQGTYTKQIVHEEHNTGQNIQPIFDMLETGQARDISDEPVVDGTPFFLLGSGGGLDDVIQKLKDWKGGIVCSTSHALTLRYYGIEPTHIICLDPFCSYEQLDGIDWSNTRTKLIAHPGVWPDLFKKWPNDILLFRQEAGRADSFYQGAQLHMFTKRNGDRHDASFDALIRTSITLFSCSPPAQLFVMRQMGYGICFLTGMNFGFDTGKERFLSYSIKRPATVAQTGNAPPIEIPIEWVPLDKKDTEFIPPDDPNARKRSGKAQDDLCKSHNGIWTDQISIFYKKNFISAWRLSQATIYTTDHGTLDEIPYADANKVIRLQGRFPVRPVKQICQTADRYLARSNNFVLEAAPKKEGESIGAIFVEVQNPEVDLPNYMVNMRQQCVCPKCGLQAVNESDREPGTEKCPRCEDAFFVRKHNFDIGDNMDRIHAVMKWVAKHTEKSTKPVPLTFEQKLAPFAEAMKLNPGLVQVFGEEINRLQVMRQPPPAPV